MTGGDYNTAQSLSPSPQDNAVLRQAPSLDDVDDFGSAVMESSSVPPQDSVPHGTPVSSHAPLSPATPAESFFLSKELSEGSHSRVSAFALAASLRSRSSGSFRNAQSIATDDFASAASELDVDTINTSGNNNMMNNNNDNNLSSSLQPVSLFGKDILVLSREPIPEDTFQYQDTMPATTTTKTPSKTTAAPAKSTKAAAVKTTTPVVVVPPTDTSTKGANVTVSVYEKAKNVWGWGNSLPLVGMAAGVAETVAGKVVSLAGTSLTGIDEAVKPQLSSIDESYLNPAISKLVGVLMGGVKKGDETLRPVVEAILSTVGIKMIKENGEPNESTPEVTPMN